MIYLDASVALAHLLVEDRAPQALARALEPFPLPLRTLDTMHLSSLLFLRERGVKIELASYDGRMLAAARALQIPLFAL